MVAVEVAHDWEGWGIHFFQRASRYGSVAFPPGKDGAGLIMDGGFSMNMRINKSWAGMTVLAMALSLHGCGGGDEDTSSTASQIVVNTPATIAQASADDYEANVNGLITAATLKRWKDGWATERAKLGLTGKLIILQVTAGPAGAEYIKPGSNAATYLSPSSEWTQTRSNGVIESVSMVPDGATMDALFKKYNIDPRNDMIVAAMGTGSNPNAMGQGRIWYALRYWGMDKKNLAILNGGNQWINTNGMTADDFQDTASTAPNTGTLSVKSLLVDNTQLQATLDDMMKVMPSADTNVKTDGVLIWDARSLGQYSAGEMVEFGEDTDSDTAANQGCATAYCTPVNPNNYMWTFQNGGSRQGHPNGTLQLQYTYMLDSTKGFSYKPKATLAAYLAGATDASGIGFVDASYGTVGNGNAYQEGDTIYTYCETTFRAMITGVASAVILGKPTRFYDGAMVEWNSLTYTTDKNGNYILPSNSPWRSDLVSFSRPATSNTLVNTRTITDPYAASANALVNADKGYKTGESAPAPGGGGAPTNPCGG
jgi:3-mercaptopyruvate sulfurtransferase SseA